MLTFVFNFPLIVFQAEECNTFSSMFKEKQKNGNH